MPPHDVGTQHPPDERICFDEARILLPMDEPLVRLIAELEELADDWMPIGEIVASGVDQMGPVMGQVMARIRGRFDGKEANRIVREELAGP